MSFLSVRENDILKGILQEFQNLEQVKAIAIGGSGANKTSDNLSDIDIYVFVEKNIPQNTKSAVNISVPVTNFLLTE